MVRLLARKGHQIAVTRRSETVSADLVRTCGVTATVVPSVTGPLQTAILTTPVAASENLALRRLYF